VRFANWFFLHVRATYYASKADIYVQPERLREDLRDVFSHPAFFTAWQEKKFFHEREFVAFVEGLIE